MLYEIIGGSRCGGLVDIPEMDIGDKYSVATDVTPDRKQEPVALPKFAYINPLPNHVYSIEKYLVCANNQLILIPNKS